MFFFPNNVKTQESFHPEFHHHTTNASQFKDCIYFFNFMHYLKNIYISLLF